MGLILIFLIVEGVAALFSNYNFGGFTKRAILTIASGIESDKYGNINILLLGVGGLNHEGGTLTDTIMLAGINPSKEKVTLLSIPRDLYVTTQYGGMRINSVYENVQAKEGNANGLDTLKEKIEEITNLKIPYYIKINFQGFEEVVDALGGIPMYIEETINDPYYPKDGTLGYSPFYISQGSHVLDGKTALKYVRSRKTTSDYDRAERQQKLLFAIKEKALSSNVLTSPSKLKDLYASFQNNVETNMSLREILALADKGTFVKKEQVAKYVLHDDFTKQGGFLYPPMRESYGGAFVLLPGGDNFDHLHRFIKYIFGYSEILSEGTKIQILNGTNKNMLAGTTKMLLKKYGIEVSKFGNAMSKTIPTTTYYFKSKEEPRIISLLQDMIPGKISSEIPLEYLKEPYTSNTEIILELGADFLPLYEKLDVFSSIVIYYGKPTEATSEESVSNEAVPAPAKTPAIKPPEAKTTAPKQ